MEDSIQSAYRERAERLQKELIEAGFMASRVVKGEDRTDYSVQFYDGVDTFALKRDYRGALVVQLVDYPYTPHVSSSTRRDVYKKHKQNNVNVITASKVQKLIDATKAERDELMALETQYASKHADFISAVHAMERLGYRVNWHKEREGHRDGEVNGGTIQKNGIVFDFELCDDGYVSKKVAVHYSVENTLPAFGALADNKYREADAIPL